MGMLISHFYYYKNTSKGMITGSKKQTVYGINRYFIVLLCLKFALVKKMLGIKFLFRLLQKILLAFDL